MNLAADGFAWLRNLKQFQILNHFIVKKKKTTAWKHVTQQNSIKDASSCGMAAM